MPIFPRELFQIAFTAGVSPGWSSKHTLKSGPYQNYHTFEGGGGRPSYPFFYKASLNIILKYFYHFSKYSQKERNFSRLLLNHFWKIATPIWSGDLTEMVNCNTKLVLRSFRNGFTIIWKNFTFFVNIFENSKNISKLYWYWLYVIPPRVSKDFGLRSRPKSFWGRKQYWHTCPLYLYSPQMFFQYDRAFVFSIQGGFKQFWSF